MRVSFLLISFALAGYLVAACNLVAATTSPKEHFGFAIGDDYKLATYTQTEAYFKKLAQESNRLKLVDLGKTEEGRTEWMLICSSPANLAKLDRYKEISQKLAHAEGLTDEQAHALANEGKAIVWIDGGLHANETLGAHQLIETLYTFASRDDAEVKRILDQVIILFVHCNPDGQELVTNFYMREASPEKRVQPAVPPRLFEKYVGHDNNRDFFMINLAETRNMARQLYVEWLPQIVYNHHQSGPPGSIVAGPPYRDPFNYVFDPLVVTSIDAVGAAMNNRMNVEGKPGYTQRVGSFFSTWWNGGLRTTPYFHNQIGLLTETIGSPTPMDVPLLPARLLPNGATPNPISPQKWHFRQSVDYSVSMNLAVLDYASRQHDELLFNFYRMGRNSIERGSTDHWTAYPRYIAAINAAFEKDKKNHPEEEKSGDASGRFAGYNSKGIPVKFYDEVLKNPVHRDPRGYIIPADQSDFPTAVKFINSLIRGGVQVHQATAEFKVGDHTYPTGSYVVKTAQAFRPHVLDMFESQDYPNDFAYEGGPPIAPYDSAGWTLAFEMGVKFDRLLEGFDGPFRVIPYGEIQSPPPGRVDAPGAGWLASHAENDSFILANRLLKAGAEAYWLKTGVRGDASLGPGTLYIPASAAANAIVEKSASELGLRVKSADSAPAGTKLRLARSRIALWDRYGGSMPSGWTRWLLERFEFPFDVIYPQQVDAGKLREKYDVIIFVTSAILRPGAPANELAAGEIGKTAEPKPEEIPEEYRLHLGKITAEKSVAPLKEFLEKGGTILAVGTSTSLAYHLGLPVRSALTEILRDGKERLLPSDKYYIPGSILRASVDNSQPIAWGMPAQCDVYVDSSPVFRLAPDAPSKGVVPLVWFADDKPLRSGWAWGQSYLREGIAAFSADVGSGHLYAFGPEITFRAQTHGTFKFLFNGLFLSTAKSGIGRTDYDPSLSADHTPSPSNPFLSVKD